MKHVFLDVDTQIDFLYPTGALAVPGATQILPHLAALTSHAAKTGTLIVSTADAHLEDDLEFRTYPPHCVKGTLGAGRVPETLTQKPTVIPFGERLNGADPAGQLIFEKRSTDMFTVSELESLLRDLSPESFVVYGVVTEICVLHAVEGLLRLGKPVTVVTDAIYALEGSRARGAMAQWQAAGCKLRKTADILAG